VLIEQCIPPMLIQHLKGILRMTELTHVKEEFTAIEVNALENHFWVNAMKAGGTSLIMKAEGEVHINALMSAAAELNQPNPPKVSITYQQTPDLQNKVVSVFITPPIWAPTQK
jgi:hypothetical protein